KVAHWVRSVIPIAASARPAPRGGPSGTARSTGAAGAVLQRSSSGGGRTGFVAGRDARTSTGQPGGGVRSARAAMVGRSERLVGMTRQGQDVGFLVVGVGSLGSRRATAAAAARGARLVAVHDTDEAAARAVARRLGAAVVGDYDAALERAD